MANVVVVGYGLIGRLFNVVAGVVGYTVAYLIFIAGFIGLLSIPFVIDKRRRAAEG